MLAQVEPVERNLRWAWRLIYLSTDALFFVACAFACARVAFLRVEGAISLSDEIGFLVPAAVAVLLSRFIYTRLYKAPLFFGLLLEFISLFAATVLPVQLSLMKDLPVSFHWLPYWWTRFPEQLWMFLRESPLFAIWLVIGFFVFTSQVARNRRWVPFGLVAGIGAILTAQYCFRAGAGFSSIEFAAIILPYVTSLVAALRGRPRLFARNLFFCFLVTFTALHYMNFFPVNRDTTFLSKPGVEVIFPTDEFKQPRAVEITDILPHPDGSKLFIAGGRSGTVASIDLQGNKIKSTSLDYANIHSLSFDTDNNLLYAIDPESDRLLAFSTEDDTPVTNKSIKTGWGRCANKAVFLNGYFYINYTDQPGLAGYDPRKQELGNGIQYTLSRPNSLRAGGWDFDAHHLTGSLIAVAGPADRAGNAAVIQINPMSFRDMSLITVPDTGPAIKAHPLNNTAYTSSFFQRRIYEIDIEKSAVARILPGQRCGRAIEIDPQRNYIYTAGYYNGEFIVADLGSGKIVRSDYVGNRVTTISLSPDGRHLYLASLFGVISIDLDAYFASGAASDDR